jgi:glucokinase
MVADSLLLRGGVTAGPSTSPVTPVRTSVPSGAHPRPSGPTAVDRSGPVLAVDIGGTKLEAGLVDGDGRILERRRTATPSAADPDEVWGALVEVVTGVLAEAPVAPVACGVGCGGPMTVGGATVSPLNIHGWRGFPLRDRLADLVGLPVEVDNDAKALALGEGWAGAARGSSDYLAMVVSTGVGGGIVLDGRLLDGQGGNAGHIGHVVVEPDGRPCACGGRGCLEAEASGTAIAARTGRPASEADRPERRRCGTLVGRAVASVAALLDLQLAVVAGSVALGYGAEFFEAAQAEVGVRCGLEFARSTTIRPGGLGADGPLVGAAAVARYRVGASSGGAMIGPAVGEDGGR